MLEELITDTNSFNEKQVDNDNITENKTYFSIYNNKISQPFHKFWFTLSNAKYFTNYNDYSTLRFALNNKSPSIQKFILFIKKLSDYLKNLFNKTFDGVTVDCPWKEYDNYPFLLSFYSNPDLLIMDSDKNILDFEKLDTNMSYSILFEIKNLKIIKTELDSEVNYNLKYNLSIIMIQQEPQLDLKSYLLNKITMNSNKSNESINNSHSNLHSNHSGHSSHSTHINKPELPFLSQLSNVSLKSDSDAKNNMDPSKLKPNAGGPKKLIDLDELLQVKSRLIKVSLESDKNASNSDDNKSGKNATLENTLIEQKNQLKKVKTKEKSLLKHLKKKSKKSKKSSKDSVELENDNNKSDSKNELVNEFENELENELENDLEKKLEKQFDSNLDNNLDTDLEKELEKEVKKDKKSKSKDKSKKKLKERLKHDVEVDEYDLEKELGLLG